MLQAAAAEAAVLRRSSSPSGAPTGVVRQGAAAAGQAVSPGWLKTALVSPHIQDVQPTVSRCSSLTGLHTSAAGGAVLPLTAVLEAQTQQGSELQGMAGGQIDGAPGGRRRYLGWTQVAGGAVLVQGADVPLAQQAEPAETNRATIGPGS